ncbi:hypothetical protein FACS1894187_18220 [Synergistales bacterium]|nr:hypothetical protein FACS1894187_18220 [Synergistales bacterium]
MTTVKDSEILTLDKLFNILDVAKDKRVLVVGDVFLDAYRFGQICKISSGVCLPIVEIQKTTFCLGGAGNIAVNIAALAGKVAILSCTGNDSHGEQIRNLLLNAGINCEMLEICANKSIYKERTYVSGQQISRSDSTTNSIANFSVYQEPLPEFDVLAICDYGYGVCSMELVEQCIMSAQKQNAMVFYTTRDMAKKIPSGIDYLFVNEQTERGWADLPSIHGVFVTKGKHGIVLYSNGKQHNENGFTANERNVSGAGDCIMAVGAALLSAGACPEYLLAFMNIARKLAIEHEITYCLDLPSCLLEYFQLYLKERYLKHLNIDSARRICDVWRECGYEVAFTNGRFDIFHVGHMRLLCNAVKPNRKLIVALNSDNSIRMFKGLSRPINSQKERVELLSRLAQVDAIVVFDENSAVETIRIINPDVYIKGEQHLSKSLPEKSVARKVEFVPMYEGVSTIKIIENANMHSAINKELILFSDVFKTIFNSRGISQYLNIPLFSFEGLPGTGKTTQIKKASIELSQKYGKGYYIDLPTKSGIGTMLKTLYADHDKWKLVSESAPWLNPVMLSVDLIEAIQAANVSGATYILMSRGILSTFYYNLPLYLKFYEDFDMAWEVLEQHLKAFVRPTAIFFFELPEQVAHNRVIKRGRGQLRAMDAVEQMKVDRANFVNYLKRLDDIPIHYIDADASQQEVLTRVDKVLQIYLGKVTANDFSQTV